MKENENFRSPEAEPISKINCFTAECVACNDDGHWMSIKISPGINFNHDIAPDLFNHDLVSQTLKSKIKIDPSITEPNNITCANIEFQNTDNTINITKNELSQDCYILMRSTYYNGYDPKERHYPSPHICYCDEKKGNILCKAIDYKNKCDYSLVKINKNTPVIFSFLDIGENFRSNLHFEAKFYWYNGKLMSEDRSFDDDDY